MKIAFRCFILVTLVLSVNLSQVVFADDSALPREVAELPDTPVGSAADEPSEAPVPSSESVIPAAVNERALVTSDGGAGNAKSLSSKKLEFEDQAINVLDADYGKLDLTAVRESDGTSARLYPIRKSFKREQQEMVKNWGIGE